MSWNLQRLLAPVSPAQFFAERFDGGTWHLPGAADKFRALFSWDDLNAILRSTRFGKSQLQLIDHGQRLPPEQVFHKDRARFAAEERRFVDVPALLSELRAGKSLLLADVQDYFPPLGELARELERAFHERIWVTLIASWGRACAFKPHWDDEDTLIVQVYGRKRWRLWGRAEALHETIATGLQRPPAAPVEEVVMRPGDLLYLPRACWHDADTDGEPSLQLMFWIPKRTGLQLLSQVTEELARDPRLLATLPRGATPEARRAHARALRQAVLERLDDGAIDRYLTALDDAAEAPPEPDLPWLLTDEAAEPDARTWVRLHTAREPRLEAHEDPDRLRIIANGASWTLPAAIGGLWAMLADGAAYSVGELAGDDDDLRQLLGQLLSAGLLTRCPAPARASLAA